MCLHYTFQYPLQLSLPFTVHVLLLVGSNVFIKTLKYMSFY